LTEKVLKEYKQAIDELSLIPSSGGVFEVTVDGEKIYSKKETGEFPDESRMIDEIGQ
jgi:selenoprotein W-related protein